MAWRVRSLRGRDDVRGLIDRFTGTDRYLVDYLVEEVPPSGGLTLTRRQPCTLDHTVQDGRETP